MKWTVEYDREVGPYDAGVREWWRILRDGTEIYRAFTEEDADYLCAMLRSVEHDS